MLVIFLMFCIGFVSGSTDSHTYYQLYKNPQEFLGKSEALFAFFELSNQVGIFVGSLVGTAICAFVSARIETLSK